MSYILRKDVGVTSSPYITNEEGTYSLAIRNYTYILREILQNKGVEELNMSVAWAIDITDEDYLRLAKATMNNKTQTKIKKAPKPQVKIVEAMDIFAKYKVNN
jgi:hypothetical protein